ncbi:uncharacterized protein BX663DRAFT_567748 [Cokeromyces recurvatus]|uniref:uncharacterized protein n=1 Tax=Cokeromyces recurvatus TaxID=90255 RepID=UPI00222037CC|nr:uncharacterized protein BX663DRAFT_567748 [Cokeromyces recurvatus]KAI7903575.1 hypothetical protein BX663DRAFT_567748 [Cokeromyces recurvatus]
MLPSNYLLIESCYLIFQKTLTLHSVVLIFEFQTVLCSWKKNKEVFATLLKQVEEQNCNDLGHCIKGGHICKKYQDNTPQVGTSNKRKCRQDDNLKRVKKMAKYSRKDVGEGSSQVVCSSSHQYGHSASRSKDCPSHKPTKAEELKNILGNKPKTVTKKN